MINELANLFEHNDRQRWIDQKVLSPYFVVLYFSGIDVELASGLNRFLFKVNEKLLRKIIWAVIPKVDRFHWDRNYIKKPKSLAIPDFEDKIKKHFNWSSKEYEANKEIVMSWKGYYCDLLNVENRTRKQLGVKPMDKASKIKKPEKEMPKPNTTLGEWM